MGQHFGYPSAKAFEDAVSAELDQIATHSHGPNSERPGQHAAQSKRQRSARPLDTKVPYTGDRPVPRITGAAGSPERKRQVRALAPDLYDEMEEEQAIQQLGVLLNAWNSSDRDDLNAQVIQEAARLTWASNRTDVWEAVRDAVDQVSGDEGLAYMDDLFAHRLQNEQNQAADEWEKAETKRVGAIQSGLADEYARIERKLGPAGLLAADEIAQMAGGALYDTGIDPEATRVALRAAAEAGKAQEAAHRTLMTVAGISEEMKKFGAPGSSWNDEQRERWEAEMDNATLEVYDRKNALAHPDLAATRALYSRAVETSDKTPFEQALDAEIGEMSKHDSTSPHQQAMRDHNVEHWAQTHEPDGSPRR